MNIKINIKNTFQEAAQTTANDIDEFILILKENSEPGSQYLTFYNNKKITSHQHQFNLAYLSLRLSIYDKKFFYTNIFHRPLKKYHDITPQIISDSKDFQKNFVVKIRSLFDVGEKIETFWFDYKSRQHKIRGLQLAGFFYLMNVKYEIGIGESEPLPVKGEVNDVLEEDVEGLIENINQEKAYQQFLVGEYRTVQAKIDEQKNYCDSKEDLDYEEIQKASIEEKKATTDILIEEINYKSASLEKEFNKAKQLLEVIAVKVGDPIDVDENMNFDISHSKEVFKNGLQSGDFLVNGRLNFPAFIEALRLKLEHKVKTSEDKSVENPTSLKELDNQIEDLMRRIAELGEVSDSETKMLQNNNITRM